MSYAILIIDDDSDLRQSLKVGLEREGFDVITAQSAEMGAEILKRISVDGIVLDRMMTGTDGLKFLRGIRGAGDLTPVIMLTAMNGPENTIAGLSGGADDYLAKPFQLRELVLRLKNILKKSTKHDLPTGLSVVDSEFFINGQLLSMSDSEKSALSNMLAGKTVQIQPMALSRLRAKLLANLKNIDIITVRGRGYKIIRK